MNEHEHQPEPAGDRGHYHYNPIIVRDTLGAVFLGIVSLALLAALLKSQARNRRLAVELARRGEAAA